MKKQDLQVGRHGVEFRNGDLYMVAFSDYSQRPFLLNDKSHTGLDGFSDDFRCREHSALDIVRVFKLRGSSLRFQKQEDETIWQEDNKQACESKIDDAESKIGLYEYKIENLRDEIISLKKRLEDEKS